MSHVHIFDTCKLYYASQDANLPNRVVRLGILEICSLHDLLTGFSPDDHLFAHALEELVHIKVFTDWLGYEASS